MALLILLQAVISDYMKYTVYNKKTSVTQWRIRSFKEVTDIP